MIRCLEAQSSSTDVCKLQTYIGKENCHLRQGHDEDVCSVCKKMYENV